MSRRILRPLAPPRDFNVRSAVTDPYTIPRSSYRTATISWRAASFRAASTTFAPASAAWSAVASPIPLEAPVFVFAVVCSWSGASWP